MKQIIIQELDKIEKEYNVRILLACESGSRAWGFPSNDSDYDVRFIYVNKKDRYLSIGDKKDVIEIPISGDLDINGWDLRKSLQLMRKSNSPLLEWLSSPIQYHVWNKPLEELLALSKKAFKPETSCHHYLSLARKSIKTIESMDKVKLKTYMYAIRPVLCCEWIINNVEHPPMRISDLLSGIKINAQVKDGVLSFIETKKQNSEKYLVERSEVIESYLNTKIVDLHSRIPENPDKLDLDLFDNVFRSIVEKGSD